jgi:hypothetical protein
MKTYYRSLIMKMKPIHLLYGFYLLIAMVALIYRLSL